MDPTPMFPLGTVLLPGMVLPLQVFEPRYRQLVLDCLGADGRFGVALIERGSEVGGGDVRTDVATIASIVDAAKLPDGRWAIGIVGTDRARVQRWLDDDPYPRAELSPWPDPPPEVDLTEQTLALGGLLRRTLALAAELGRDVAPATVELVEDPVAAGYHAAALAPLGPSDRQRVLGAASPAQRVNLVAELLGELADELEAELRVGAADDPDQ